MKKKKVTDKVKIFVDSGAYSAMTQKQPIDIYDYIDFIQRNQDKISVYANLDVIGSAEGTLKNQQIMESNGLKPLPVYHLGEDISYLKQYSENYDYMAIGGAAGVYTGPRLRDFLDFIWGAHLLNEEGFSKVKVHGFGITSIRLLIRYPWYSVDSTTWVRAAAYGTVFIPPPLPGGNGYNYRVPPHPLSVSDQSNSVKEVGKHFSSYPPLVRKKILEYLQEKGEDMENLASDYRGRTALNIQYFLDFAKTVDKNRSYKNLKRKSGFFQ